MPTYRKDTGLGGYLMVSTNNIGDVEFFLGDYELTPQVGVFNIPWAYTANGQTVWSSFEYDFSKGSEQRVGYVRLTYNQSVTFQIAFSGVGTFGGPTEMTVKAAGTEATSAPAPGTGGGGSGGGSTPEPEQLDVVKTFVQAGLYMQDAIPWVNILGVWQKPIVWVKHKGKWYTTEFPDT